MTVHCPANIFDFPRVDRGGLTCKSHDRMHSRRGENGQAVFQTAAEKYVTRKERQGQALLPVSPLPDRFVKREEDLQPTSGEVLSDGLLVLMSSVDRVPLARFTI